jgi:hypothetical protein
VAVILGDVSGNLCCRDFDNAGAYQAWVAQTPDYASTLPTAQTARGFHVYFTATGQATQKLGDGNSIGGLRQASTRKVVENEALRGEPPQKTLDHALFEVELDNLLCDHARVFEDHGANWGTPTPARTERGRWACPLCAQRGRVPVDLSRGLFQCWTAGCAFHGSVHSLARRLGRKMDSPELREKAAAARRRHELEARAQVLRVQAHKAVAAEFRETVQA